MKPQTLQAVKAMTKDQNVINAATAVFQAMAYEQTVREVIEPKQQEVVDFYKFKIAMENRQYGENYTSLTERRYRGNHTITRPQDMYLSDDQDFKIYAAEMDSFHREKGFQKPSPDHCPLLMAEHLTRQTKWAFVDLLEAYTGMSSEMLFRKYSLYKQYIDLNLSLFAPLVKIN